MSKRSRGQAMLAAVSVKRTGIMRPESEKKRTDLLSKPSHHHNGEEDFKLGMKLKLARLNSSQSSYLTDQGKTNVQSTPVKENLGSSQNTSSPEQKVQSDRKSSRGHDSTPHESAESTSYGDSNKKIEKSSVIPPSPAEVQYMKLKNDFKLLEVAVTNLSRKRQVTWEQARQYVENLSASSFELKDLELILTVWPEALVLHWRKVSTRAHAEPEDCLCISLAPLPSRLPGEPDEDSDLKNLNEGQEDRKVLSVHNRQSIFAEKLLNARKLLISNASSTNDTYQNNDTALLQAKPNLIPVKKDKLEDSIAKRHAIKAVTPRDGALSSISPKVKHLDFAAQQCTSITQSSTVNMDEQSSQSGTIHSSQNTVNTSNKSHLSQTPLSGIGADYSRVKGDTLGLFGSQDFHISDTIVSIEKLREMALEREKATKQQAINVVKERKRLQARTRLESLVPLGDTLRSIGKSSRMKNTYSMTISDAITQLLSNASTSHGHFVSYGVASLSSSMKGLNGQETASQEMMTRLKLIAREAPDFLVIHPPDDIIPEHSLTINLQNNYSEVRSKLADFTARALQALQAKVY